MALIFIRILPPHGSYRAAHAAEGRAALCAERVPERSKRDHPTRL